MKGKKLISLLAAAAMFMATMPVFAADAPEPAAGGTPEYADAADERASLMSGGNIDIATALGDKANKTTPNGITTYELTDDVTLTSVIEIGAAETVVLDLAGHTIKQTGTTTRVDDYGEEYDGGINAILNYGNLTVKDEENKDGKIIGGWNGVSNNEGILTVESGTIIGNGNNGIWNNGTVTVNGGTIIGKGNNGIANSYSTDDEGNITSRGTLTVTKGTIVGEAWHGIGNFGGDVNISGGDISGSESALCILPMTDEYDEPIEGRPEAIINISGGTFTCTNWTAIDISDGTTTITNGKYVGGMDIGSDATVNITGGDFSGVTSDRWLSIKGDVTVADTFTGKIKVDKVTTTAGACNLFDCGNITLAGEIIEGEYTVVGLNNANIPENSTAKITLNNAVIDRYTNIAGGTFTGTVSVLGEPNLSLFPEITGGTYSKELKESIDATNETFHAFKFSDGYGWVQNDDEQTYRVEYVGFVNFKIQSNNSEAGTITSIFYDGGSTTDGHYTWEPLSKGGCVLINSTEVKVLNGDYKFKGWYTDPNGEGACISNEENLNRVIQVNEDMTVYAVFVESSEYSKLTNLVNAWLYQEDGKTLKDSYEVASIEDMFCFAYAVNDLGINFSEKTVTLTKSLDYKDSTIKFRPVGIKTEEKEYMFKGTFDGGNNTISNINLEGNNAYMGIFGYNKGTIRNLTVENCLFNAYGDVGGIAAWSEGTIENCSVLGCTLTAGDRYCGGIVGHTYGMTMSNVVSENNTISGGKSGGIIGYADGLELIDASVSGNTRDTENKNMIYAAVAGHLNAGNSKMVDLDVNAPGESLIATNYSWNVSQGNLVISGENTKITAENVIAENESSMKTIEIQGGSYEVEEIVSEETDKEGVTVVGGRHTAEIGEYVPTDKTDPDTEKPYTWTQTMDGRYIVKNSIATYISTYTSVTSEIGIDRTTMIKALDGKANADTTYSVLFEKTSPDDEKAIKDEIEKTNGLKDATVEAVNITIWEKTGSKEKDVTDTFNTNLKNVGNGKIKVTYKLPVKAVAGSEAVAYHYDGITVGDSTPAKFGTDNQTVTFEASGFSDWAIVYTADNEVNYDMTEDIGVSFEYDKDGAYDIKLRPQDGKNIYRFLSADLTFALTKDGEADLGTLVYTIKPDSGVNLIQKGDNRYEFNLDGFTRLRASGEEVKIGTVTFSGYGKGKFTVAEEAKNVVNTSIQTVEGVDLNDDSLVIHYTANGTEETGDKLSIGNAVGKVKGIIYPKLKPVTSALTVNVTFPNEAKDNKAEYQQMYVTVSGGDLTQAQKIALATVSETDGTSTPVEGNFANDGTYTVTYKEKKAAQGATPAQAASYEVVITDMLTRGIAYNVEVSGEGYRTAHYTVLMDGAKTLTFWNNFRDDFKAIEEGKATSAVESNFLAGDIVADNIIDLYDLSAVLSYFGKMDLNKYEGDNDALKAQKRAYAQYDLNRDGIIDSKDIAYVLVSWGK